MQDLQTKSQTFETLRTQNFMYVDKTKHVYELAKKDGAYFLSRPRRFGKSLLVSTFEALFKNKKELFKDLYIYDKWEWGTEYPVIKIDFGEIKTTDTEILNDDLIKTLNENAENNNLELDQTNASIPKKFSELIKKLYQEKKQKVVILIDEYDKAIRNNLDKSIDIQTAIREVLRDFYEVIKAKDQYIRFIFLTGVTKFAGLSLFSGLNTLNDITLDDKYSAICGYTQEELETNFVEYIEALAKKYASSKKEILAEIRTWYNGYTWDGKTAIYNPFSTLLLFSKLDFANYWYASGSPKFLIDYLQKNWSEELFFETIDVFEEELMSSEADPRVRIGLLFQTGYLTIKAITLMKGAGVISVRKIYTLMSPNCEVGISLAQTILMPRISEVSGAVAISKLLPIFAESIAKEDEKIFAKGFDALIALVPYQIQGETESHYASNLLLSLKLMGFNVLAEKSGHKGRADIVWKYDKSTVVIIEMKYAQSTQQIPEKIQEAFKQIEEKEYYKEYTLEADKIILVALVVSDMGKKFEVEFNIKLKGKDF
ncbi:MAG: ATP-binding protein [Elusimicrobiota bacterium]|jgi:competence protein ComGC|nr:ATP-binding protein [Elusimicrobiota bacterium]